MVNNIITRLLTTRGGRVLTIYYVFHLCYYLLRHAVAGKEVKYKVNDNNMK